MDFRTGNRAVPAGVLACAVFLAAWASPARAQGLQSSDSNDGYLDNAIPGNMVRLRAETAYDLNRSDRAEYIYSTGFDPRLNNQVIATYVEFKLQEQLSGFFELTEHFVEPSLFPDAGGLGDLNAGFKWAFLYEPDRVVTFQLRAYAPSGNPLKALGNGHAAIEPAFLYYRALPGGWTLEGEFKEWAPIGGTGTAGNVLRYGLGLSYAVVPTPRLRICPVVELVGWTVLNGKESVDTAGDRISAAGDTIVNGKFGVRTHFGCHSDFYVGYGRALTGDVWYKDIIRLEYRLSF